MASQKIKKRQFCILVKAYPQPSKTYEETVCCAAITATGELLRLYPVPYRHLKPEQQFKRYDWIEADAWKATEDFRPESYKISPDSIRIVKPGAQVKPEERIQLWLPHICSSIENLREQNKQSEKSLGIVKPDAGSIQFTAKPIDKAKVDEKDLATTMVQSSLLEESLSPLKQPDFVFGYNFTSDGIPFKGKIHDWEVAAAYYRFKRLYGSRAIDIMIDKYQNDIPTQNPHIILGTMSAHPRQFIIIGLLRSQFDPEKVPFQNKLFS